MSTLEGQQMLNVLVTRQDWNSLTYTEESAMRKIKEEIDVSS